MSWITPKTDWQDDDYINVGDFNRIRDNLVFLKQKAEELYPAFDYTTPISDHVSYASYSYVSLWNSLEEALNDIVVNTYDMKIGDKRTFVPLEPYIDSNELNRLERACLTYYNMLVGQKENVKRLSFVLGNEEMRI